MIHFCQIVVVLEMDAIVSELSTKNFDSAGHPSLITVLASPAVNAASVYPRNLVQVKGRLGI